MELPRTRDCITLVKGQTFPVGLSANLLQSGWAGGQGVMWIDSPYDIFVVDFSDGTPNGFLLWGSNESADQFTAYTQNQPTYNFAVLCYGTWVITTSTFEKYTYASRVAGPPYVPITYNPSDRLLFSLRGLFTNEDEWALETPPDPRAPNRFYVGYVIECPAAYNNNFIMLQTTM
jgi:hypothetical protein